MQTLYGLSGNLCHLSPHQPVQDILHLIFSMTRHKKGKNTNKQQQGNSKNRVRNHKRVSTKQPKALKLKIGMVRFHFLIFMIGKI
jgi:hypothetical protein